MADPFFNPLKPVTKKTSSNFAAPSKEQATTGRWMDAGDDYGLGFKNPVGNFGASSYDMGPIPLSCRVINPDEL